MATHTYQQLIGMLNKAESEAADGAALVSAPGCQILSSFPSYQIRKTRPVFGDC